MKAKELRDFSAADLANRVNTWKEEIFRSRFKMEQSEARDTSIIRKLRRDVARAYTILAEKQASGDTSVPAKQTKAAAAPIEDKPVKKAAAKTAKPKAKKSAKAEE